MNKSLLIKNLSQKADTLNEKDIDSVVNLIVDSLASGNRVEVRNFGTFSLRLRKKRLSRNPKTGTSVLVDEKKHPYFRASKNLKESLNK